MSTDEHVVLRGWVDALNLVETRNRLERNKLESENAKLRELCRMLFDELYTLIDDNCSDVYTQYERSDVQPFYDELRELGVEVDV